MAGMAAWRSTSTWWMTPLPSVVSNRSDQPQPRQKLSAAWTAVVQRGQEGGLMAAV